MAFGTAQMNLSEKVFLYFLPAIGASLTFLDIVFLLKKALQGEFLAHYEWLFVCSRFAVWVSFYVVIAFDVPIKYAVIYLDSLS